MEKRTRVLLADANEEFRILLRQLLEETGEFEVAASTGDGPMVMELVRRTKPELILMDVVLPGLDGFGILRQLAEEPGERKVIVISAFCSQQAVSRAVELGVYFFLPKPVNEESLLELMRQAVHPEQEEPYHSPALEGDGNGHHSRDRRTGPYQGLSVSAGGHFAGGGRHGRHQRRHQGTVPGGGTALFHHSQPGGAGHSPRH